MKTILLLIVFLICVPLTRADMLGINVEFSPDKQGQSWVSIHAGYLTNYDRVNVSVKAAAEDLRNIRFDFDGKFAVIHSKYIIPRDDLMEILQAMSANNIMLYYIQIGLGPPTGMDIWNGTNVEVDRELTRRISEALTQSQLIKPGMTRAQISKIFNRIFTTEGGISTASHRTYVYISCPYIKVDVDFKLSDPNQGALEEKPTDTVTRISRPYLDWSVID